MLVDNDMRYKIDIYCITKLYPLARGFVNDISRPLSNSQASGLKNIAVNASEKNELYSFINKQGNKDNKNSEFYNQLNQKVKSIEQDIAKEGLIPENEALSKKEKKAIVDFYALLVLREFIFHLVSHNAYKANTGRD